MRRPARRLRRVSGFELTFARPAAKPKTAARCKPSGNLWPVGSRWAFLYPHKPRNLLPKLRTLESRATPL